MNVRQETDAAFKKYQEIYKRFKAGDRGVSESDVNSAYSHYLGIGFSHDNQDGLLPYLPYSL